MEDIITSDICKTIDVKICKKMFTDNPKILKHLDMYGITGQFIILLSEQEREKFFEKFDNKYEFCVITSIISHIDNDIGCQITGRGGFKRILTGEKYCLNGLWNRLKEEERKKFLDWVNKSIDPEKNKELLSNGKLVPKPGTIKNTVKKQLRPFPSSPNTISKNREKRRAIRRARIERKQRNKQLREAQPRAQPRRPVGGMRISSTGNNTRSVVSNVKQSGYRNMTQIRSLFNN